MKSARSTPKRFLINGSIAFDLLLGHDGSFLTGIDPSALQKLSVNYLAQTFVRHHGGTAANIGWTLSLLGHKPTLVSSLGLDGGPYATLLEERGIDLQFVDRHQDAITATAVIGTDSHERQISFFHPGADAHGKFPDLSTMREEISYAIMSPRNPLLMLQGAAACHTLKIPYLFDPGQVVHAFGADELKRAISQSAGLVVNEYEWSLVQKKLEWNEDDALAMSGLLVITLGEKGLRILTEKEDTMIPACQPEKFINPTGAGDAARAGLLIGLASGWSMSKTGRLAAALGCLATEQEGTLLQDLTWETVEERILSAYGSMSQ